MSFIIMQFATLSFAQSVKKNGTIYINHPYIDIVNRSVNAYQTQNIALWRTFYTDSVKFGVNDNVKISLK